MLFALRQSAEQLHDPRHEISEIRQQISPEAFESDLSGRENQHDAKQKKIHEIDDD